MTEKVKGKSGSLASDSTGQAKYFNAFNLIEGIGPISFKKILSYFSSLKEAWTAKTSQFIEAGLDKFVVEQIKKQRPYINPEQEMERLAKEEIDLITLFDKNYPKLLKEIYAPPPVLYIRGSLKPADELSLAIVGTRKLSSYGRQITPFITAELSQNGLTVVSGLAKGIDTLAHQTALKSGGRTIAVLGSAIDRKSIYPPVNRDLAEEIVQNGAIISEFPINTKPTAQNFPRRNRVISGLSLGVLVIEAPEKSGALITANNALEQNRDIFAVPGHILSHNSFGPNNLIKMGAKLVDQANDIFQELNLNLAKTNNSIKNIPAESREEILIIKELSDQPTHIDKIIIRTKLSAALVNSTLTLMEMKGKVRNVGANNYILEKSFGA
jgi:DNA processing protein